MATQPINPELQEPHGLAARPRRQLVRGWRLGDPLFYALTWACATSIVLITAWLVYQLYINSAESRHAFGWKFLLSQEWDPVAGDFGALPFIFGTVVTSIVALLIAVPLGLGTAIFLAE